jgi:hypothetical protein
MGCIRRRSTPRKDEGGPPLRSGPMGTSLPLASRRWAFAIGRSLLDRHGKMGQGHCVGFSSLFRLVRTRAHFTYFLEFGSGMLNGNSFDWWSVAKAARGKPTKRTVAKPTPKRAPVKKAARRMKQPVAASCQAGQRRKCEHLRQRHNALRNTDRNRGRSWLTLRALPRSG